MKRFRKELIFATVAASLATGARAFAEDTPYDPVQRETGSGLTRGIDIRPTVPIPVVPVAKPVPAEVKPVVKQPVAHTVQPIKNATAPKATVTKIVKHPVKQTVKTATAPCAPHVNRTEISNVAPVQPNQGQFVNVSHQTMVNSSNVVTATLDRSGSLPKYKVGDKLVVNIKANQDCNLVVFNYDSTGTLTQIFPNDYQQSGYVRNGDSVQIGGPESPFDYQVAGKGGQEKIFVYAYPTGSEAAPITVAMNPLAGTPFRSAEITPEQYRQMVNDSKVFFSREVKVVPKRVANASATQTAAANKIELSFVVEK
ncbi:MAG: DUF4384 domain-containing protein [Candidatus Obscuribacterales bacterium]|nr:DUF4384 domain-containing protein [Candidatus Obscuribacterales bacterium]